MAARRICAPVGYTHFNGGDDDDCYFKAHKHKAAGKKIEAKQCKRLR